MTLAVITHDEHVAAHSRRRVRIVDGVLTEIAAAPAGSGSPR
jgi:predicted ABC-type transport system involved in lysophospholipase L1 biosynthesis ATPase subunit